MFRRAFAACALGLALTPSAHAAVLIPTNRAPRGAVRPLDFDVITFTGTFSTACEMPLVPRPHSGRYTCHQATESRLCTGISNAGPALPQYGHECKADLVDSELRGHATLLSEDTEVWTCDSGAGTGTFRYQASPGSAAIRFPVDLALADGRIHVFGRYVQPGRRRTLIVRADYPALCTIGATLDGAVGSVLPVNSGT